MAKMIAVTILMKEFVKVHFYFLQNNTLNIDSNLKLTIIKMLIGIGCLMKPRTVIHYLLNAVIVHEKSGQFFLKKT